MKKYELRKEYCDLKSSMDRFIEKSNKRKNQ